VGEKKIGLGITVDTADTFYTVLTFTYRRGRKETLIY
jgi:hypothetical protein